MSDPVQPESFATYLVKYLIATERYQPGTVPEATALQEGCDLVLTRSDGLSLQILCLVDREADPARQFGVSRDALERIGTDCLKYCGTVNRTKIPVVIRIIEVSGVPAGAADQARLMPYRRFSAVAKVQPTAFVLCPADGSVWSNLPAFRRWFGHGKFEKLLRQPRRSDAELAERGAPALQTGGRPLVTFALLALLAVVFLAEQVFRVDGESSGLLGPGVATLAALGGLDKMLVLEQGQWYRLVSAFFLHADLFHLLMNGLALFLAGRVLELLVGRWWFLALFFIGGVCGSLVSLALNPPELLSVGASGAIMALLAAAYVCSFRVPWGPERQRAQMGLLPILVASLIPLAPVQTGHPIDFAAHLGGAASGLGLGFALLRAWPLDQVLPRFRPLAAAVALLGLCAAAGTLWPIAGQYQAWRLQANLIPDETLPQDEAQAKARSAALVAQYPADPRGHFMHAMALMDEADGAGAEAELRAALTANAALPGVFTAALADRLQTVLALVLQQNGKPDEARRAAAPVCRTSADDDRSELQQAGLCP